MYDPRLMYSLRHPPAGIPFAHLLIWPLIYAQIRTLSLWVRSRYGRGVPFWFQVSPWGRVTLLRMPIDAGRGSAAPVSLEQPRFAFRTAAPSSRLRLALAAALRVLVAPLARLGGKIAAPASSRLVFDTS